MLCWAEDWTWYGQNHCRNSDGGASDIICMVNKWVWCMAQMAQNDLAQNYIDIINASR